MANCSNLNLTEIPHNLPNYTDWLIVSGNNISFLNQEILQHSFLPHLTKLDISRNSLNTISKEFIDLFVHCYSRLFFLDISNNNLTTLPRNIQNMSSLQSLRFSGNILECICENIWIKDWLNKSDIIEDSTNISCTMPSGEEIQMLYTNTNDMDCPTPESITTANLWKILGFIHIFKFLITFQSLLHTINFCLVPQYRKLKL